jgi:DNA polymerase III subunit gamma/tau
MSETEPSLLPNDASTLYRVLARKYRPRNFEDLIGQDAMVRTLANAFESGRIPQAWMLTGVRGVGKTTTARILARALNYKVAAEDGQPAIDRPTTHMPVLGEHCQAIIEGRHIDILEIDAASNNGVDNIRQINDAVRYTPVSARYKVYIVDEVHMLSAGAFNAFLKTLEEPPPHAKFIFATTEIRKVPVTILSRCQRFDLRRVEADVLIRHLQGICAAEGVEAQQEALSSIVRAAEGSVRDALSLLDQAIAHSAGHITAETVRTMLGLADRAKVIDLFEAVMRGDVPQSFAVLRGQYEAGADPAVVLTDLAQFSHLVTRFKLAPDAAQDHTLSQGERERGHNFSQKLSVRVLSRAWQILMNGISEVQSSARPLAAAEMVLVRLAYAADLPTPDEALRRLKEERSGTLSAEAKPRAEASPRAESSTATTPHSSPVMRAVTGGGNAALQTQPIPQKEAPPPLMKLARFEDVVALAGQKRELALKDALERDVRLVDFADGHMSFSLTPNASPTLPNQLAKCLDAWTGRRWVVALSSDQGTPTLREQYNHQRQEQHEDAALHPLVQAVLTRFPGAKIVDVRHKAETQSDAAPENITFDPEIEIDF